MSYANVPPVSGTEYRLFSCIAQYIPSTEKVNDTLPSIVPFFQAYA